MSTEKIKVFMLTGVFLLSFLTAAAQETFDLQECLQYALENNQNLKKSMLDREKSGQAKREMLGALLPQVNGTGSMSYNIQKAKFIMPNFINSMLPPAAQDPNAAEYMTIEMGMNYNAGLGVSLNQQLFNLSLFNSLEILKNAEKMAELGIESKEEDIIAQTATLYYAIQSTSYAAGQFEHSIRLIDKMLSSMEASFENGLVKKVDLDRLKITRVNLLTQQSAIKNAASIQTNLLKLQMGFDINQEIDIDTFDLQVFEANTSKVYTPELELDRLVPYRIMQKQKQVGELQVKSVRFETLPTLSLGLNYQHNFVSDEFFTGDTYYHYPNSLIGLNLRVPIFAGLSKNAKLEGARIELEKIRQDERMLNQSLTMAYRNALLKLEDSRRTIEVQRENMKLAGQVYAISESNYLQGLASMSDVLNANSSLIQSQVTYADALNNYMKACIELRKANGSIRELVEM